VFVEKTDFEILMDLNVFSLPDYEKVVLECSMYGCVPC
jgi:hypothetical protein